MTARAPAADQRRQVIDGRPAAIVERQPVLPPRLDTLLRGIQHARVNQVVVRGTGVDCGDHNHAFALWIRGLWGARELALGQCVNCGTVEVRDISYDLLDGMPRAGMRPRRGDELLGWYSGKRPLGRTYI